MNAQNSKTFESHRPLTQKERLMRTVAATVGAGALVATGFATNTIQSVGHAVGREVNGDMNNKPPVPMLGTVLRGRIAAEHADGNTYEVEFKSGPGATDAERHPTASQAAAEFALAEGYRPKADNVYPEVVDLSNQISNSVQSEVNGGVMSPTTVYVNTGKTPITIPSALQASPNLHIDKLG